MGCLKWLVDMGFIIPKIGAAAGLLKIVYQGVGLDMRA